MQRQDFHEDIAVVGMSCRVPQCTNLEDFWNVLEKGADVTSTPPGDRYLQKDYPTKIPENCRNSNAGFIPWKVDEFDAAFFGISPMEAVFMDPQQRLLHELVWEGLEDAGIDPLQLKGTNGAVFMGSWTNDYKDILLRCGYEEFYRRYMGNSIGAASAKIAFHLGMTGPCISTESGCSSAMVAVHMACKSLQRGETNMALACGVNLLLKPIHYDELPLLLAGDGRCKPFDSRADGFGRAEGGGVLVLKRLSDAVKDTNRIWAVIKGSAISQEGLSKSMGTPTVYSESLAMELALKDARVDPSQVSLIEAHGTGTGVGDPMEILSIAKAYNTEKRGGPLLITSVKGNVGHTESASGMIGIIKVILSMKYEKIPRQVNLIDLNPSIDLSFVQAEIPLTQKNWNRSDKSQRIAGVSSFGITGTDAHVILEEPPATGNTQETCQSKTERPCHVLKLTAKTDEALNILLGRYKEYVMNSDAPLSDIAFTANTCRTNLKCRAVVTGKSTEEIVMNIEKGKYLKKEVGTSRENGKICFLFTGQGSQYSGMAQQIYDTSPIFQDAFDMCADFLQHKYQINIKQAIWGTNNDDIQKTIYSQTSIFCVEYALTKLWESLGVKPDYVLGHSLGEFSAAVCANILTIEDALTLVAERSLLIEQLPPGKMLVIKAEKKVVETSLQKFSQNKQMEAKLDFAAINSNEQTVVAGDSEEIMTFSKWCDENGLKNVVLKSNHAFHSRHIDPMLEQYRQVAEKTTTVRSHESNCKYISGMLGKVVENDTCFNAEYCVQHTRKPVLFLEASHTAAREGCSIFVEIGPQPVLSALTMANINTMVTCLPSLKRNDEDWSTLLNSLGSLYVNGVEIDWAGLDKPYLKRERVQLPHYPFIGKRFWPEIAITQSSAVHPLLGAPFTNPLSSKLFHSGINLKILPFLKDHVVGEHIVFPGVGYLEMCLAAGINSIEDPSLSLTKLTRPIAVKNLTIDFPLILNDSSASEIHTVVDFGVSDDASVKIFHRTDSGKWVLHANAAFEILASNLFQGIEKIITSATILKSKGDKKTIEHVYDKLASVGLNFGDTFRSLDTVWKNADDAENVMHVFRVRNLTEEQRSKQFLIHPVVQDAMVQAYIFDRLISKDIDNIKKMPLPVKIGKFVMMPMSPNHTEDNFVHILSIKSENDVAEKIAVLADSEGQVKCVMSQVEFVNTTVKHFDAIVRQHTNKMPDLWEETWEQKDDFSAYRFHPEKALGSDIFSEDLQMKLSKLNENPSEQACGVYKLLEELSFLHMIKSLLELGWSMELGSTFETTEFRKRLGIIDEHQQYFGFILHTLERKGLIAKVGEETWKLTNSLPSLDAVNSEIMSPTFTVELMEQFRESLLLSRVGDNLPDILRGGQSALNILFPVSQDNSLPSAAEWYKGYMKMSGCETMSKEVLSKRMNYFTDAMNGQRFVLRILEVGAGTGVFTEILLEVLEDAGVDFEYTYTDISSSFFHAAEKKFKKYSKHMKFLKFNIEEDPLTQGLMPEYYDYICGYDVIHATKNIQETLANLRMVLKPYGKLEITDSTKVTTYVTFIYGLLSGYWRFEDHRIQKSHCTMDIETWKSELTSAGYKVEQVFPVLYETHSLFCTYRTGSELKSQLKVKPNWLVFHAKEVAISGYLIKKLISAGRNVKTVGEEKYVNNLDSTFEGVLYCFGLDKSRKNQEEVLEPLFQFAKRFLSYKHNEQMKSPPKLVVLTQGTVPVFKENDDLSGFNANTLLGFCKSLSNETIDLNCSCVDIEEDCAKENEMKMNRIFQEMFNKERDLLVAFRNGCKFVPKLQAVQPLSSNQQDLPISTRSSGMARFQLILPESRSISDLKFGPLEMENLQDYEIEIQVKAAALNFRDVLTVLKPIEYFKSMNAVGFDITGEVIKVGASVSRWKPGDVVCSMNFEGKALPSHVQIHEDHAMSVPLTMSCCEAATLPAVFITAFLGLVEIAKLKRNEYVLLHTASGGVGLAAIDLCKNIGAQIIATAGSKVKRRYLRRLGIKHVFNSRNTSYQDQIMNVTKGHGVDVVLNSLTGKGFQEASLAACAKGARFIEMSKINVLGFDEVNGLRPDVDYQRIDVSCLDESTSKYVVEKMAEYVEMGITKPLPYVRFSAVNIREALHFLQKTKHIGKVVCVMPELKKIAGESQFLSPMFNDRSTYLITGGLGGIGFVVCKWMVERGAKHVVLAGRSPPKLEVLNQINEINGIFHANCVAVELDVGDYKACESLIKEKLPKMGMPPLKGIMHSAGILADGLIVNQTWERLQLPFRAKIKGTINLHQVTLDMNLEYFVLFSSMTATLGTPGQCNHAAACHFEDGFAHYRRSIGLPATTINWGPWLETGVATDVEIPGAQSITNSEGLKALEYALKSIRTQTSVFTIDSFERFKKWWPKSASYMEDVNWKKSSLQTNASFIKPDVFWATYDSKKNVEDKETFLRDNVLNTLFSVLRMKETDYKDDATFQEMGVDSLMFVEIRHSLQEIFGDKVVVRVNLLMEAGTINSATKALLNLIETSRNSQMN